jgi:hypothetical protein
MAKVCLLLLLLLLLCSCSCSYCFRMHLKNDAIPPQVKPAPSSAGQP